MVISEFSWPIIHISISCGRCWRMALPPRYPGCRLAGVLSSPLSLHSPRRPAALPARWPVHKGLSRWRPSSVFAAPALRHSHPRSGSPGLVSCALPLSRRGCTPGRACSQQRSCCSPGPEPGLSLIFLFPYSVCSGPAPCVLGCSFPEHHLFSCLPSFACTVLCLQWLPNLPCTTPVCLSRWRSGIPSDIRAFSSQAPTIKSWQHGA